MNRRLPAVVMVFTVTALTAWAQSFSVSYVEGDARVARGSSWAALSIGDSLPAQSVVQLADGAYVELSSPGARISLSQKGTYSLQNVLSSFRALGSAGAGKALLQSLSRIVSGPGGGQVSAGGARAADASQEQDDQWVTSSADSFMSSGKESLQSGEYDKAIEQFQQALVSADAEAVGEVHYRLAEAYLLKGDLHGALKQVTGLQPLPQEGWAPDFVLLKAQIFVSSFAYSQAVSWLTQPGNDLSADAQRAQLYLFLLGAAYRGMGDAAKAATALSAAAAISRSTELGQAATQLLQTK